MIHVNLVLSGGGARGMAHLGVVQALQEEGYYFDRISGVSIGAITGAFIAAGYKPREVLSIFEDHNYFTLLRPAFNDGLFKMNRIETALLNYFPDNSFEKLNTPLIVSASDIEKGETVFFDSGELIRPLLASSALPVIFTPVKWKEKTLIDGGVLNNFPVEPFLNDNLTLLGVHVNPWSEDGSVDSTLEVLERSVLLSIYGTVLNRKEKCHLFIEPEGLSRYSVFEFDRAREIFETGYKYTKAQAGNLLKAGFYCGE